MSFHNSMVKIGDLSTKIGQFDIAGLISGDPLSLATLPFQLYNAFTFDQRQADATRPQREAENFERFYRGELGIPTDLLELGRGGLGRGIDAVQGSDAFRGDAREALLASLGDLDPVIGRTSLDDVSAIPARVVEIIQDFTDRVVQELASELSQATFELDFARQSGGDVQGALQNVIGAQTALYQEQIDSYNLQRQATGVQIGNVGELNRILQQLNNETRLQLDALPSTGTYLAGLRDARATAQRTGTDTQATRDVALAQYGADAFEGVNDAGQLIPVGFEDIDVTEIDPAIAELSRFDADTGFEDSFNNFRNNINAAAATIETINTEFASFQESVLRPRFDYLRGLILDDDGVISAAEELALKETGVFSFEDFSDPFREVADGAIMGITVAQEALANYTAGSQFEQNVNAFNSSLTEAGNTIEDINTAWQGFVENTLRPEFDRLRSLILDDDGIVSASEALALRQAGVFSFQDFTGQFIGIKDAAIMGITSTETALANYVAGSGFESNVNAFRSSIRAAGNTIADVNGAWQGFIENTLRPEFDRLRGLILDDDGIIDATEALALRQAGVFTFEDFTSRFVGLRDAAVMGIQTTTEALANYVSDSGFESNVNAFRSSLAESGNTVADVNVAWSTFIENTLRPEYQRLRSLILDDDGIISVAEALALRRAGVFTFEDFTGRFVGLRDSAVMGITSTELALADYIASSGFETNVNAFGSSVAEAGTTIADVNVAWSTFQENVLRPEYERLRGLILDDDGIISVAEELALRQAGVFTFEDFTGQFVGLRDAAVMGITSAQEAANRQSEQESRQAQEAANRALEAIQATEDALVDYIAGSAFESNVNVFRDNILAVINTVADVNTAWGNFVENTLRPEYERIRDTILDDDGIVSAAEELALRRAGVFSFEDFTGQFIGIKSAAVMGIQTAEQVLGNYVAESGFEQNVNAFGLSITESGNTIADVNMAWQGFVDNTLRPEFERLRGLILDDDGIVSAAEELALRQAGVFTFEDFTGQFVGIKDAAVIGIETATEALANYVSETGFEQNVNAFNSSIAEAGTTIADVNVAWSTFQENVLRPEYDRLRGLILDDDGIVSVAEELALRQAGVFSFEDFTGQFTGIKDAAVMGITSTTDALADYIASSGFESNVEAFNSSITAIGNTIADVNVAWGSFVENTLRPEFERLRGLILDDDGIVSVAEELSLRQAGVFTFDDFTGEFTGLRDDAVTGIQNAARARQNAAQASQQRGLRTQSNLSQNAIQRGRFFLSDATDEGDFEVRRNRLIGLTNDYYDDELTRINGLMLSEGELQDLREDNQLDRIKGLRELDDLENGFAEDRISREERVARVQERRQQQFAGIGLDTARSREDLDIGLGRSIQDLLREALPEHLAGGTPSADRLASIFQPGTDVGGIVGSDIFNRLFEGIGDARRDFITEGVEDLLIPFGRGLEDISRDSGRSEADFLSDIAIEESNNQWKSDISAIALNTSQMDMLDPMLGPDSERIDPLMSDTRDLLGVPEAGQKGN